MKKRRNALFSFHPGLLTGRQRRARGRVPYNRKAAAMMRRQRARIEAPWPKKFVGSSSAVRDEVAEALVAQGYRKADAQKMARSASGDDFSSLFRSALARNPRFIPAVTDEQLKALRKLVRQKKTMAGKKRRSRKKRNSHKGTMPAGLRKYWARKRAAKARRRANARKARRRNARPRPRRRKVSLRVRRFRRTARRMNVRRRRRSNPKRRTSRIRAGMRIRPPFPMTAGQLKKYARHIARATGLRTRIVRP